jgi:hypothetical protein
VRLERLGKLKKKKNNDLIGTRTRDLPTCSIVPQPTTLREIRRLTTLWAFTAWYRDSIYFFFYLLPTLQFGAERSKLAKCGGVQACFHCPLCLAHIHHWVAKLSLVTVVTFSNTPPALRLDCTPYSTVREVAALERRS